MNAFISANAISHDELRRDQLGWLQRREGERYASMIELRKALDARSQSAYSEVIDNRQIEFKAMDPRDIRTKDDMNALLVKVGDRVVGMSHWAFGQAVSLAKSPAGYLRTLPAPLVADALNYSMRFNRDVEKVMTYGDRSNLRAVTGPTYGRVSDADVVGAVATVLDSGRWVPAEAHMGLQATDRSLQMFLIDRERPVVVGKTWNGGDDILYRGLRISNSELGYSSLKMESFLFRSYCLNGMIFGKKEVGAVAIRHSKNAPYRWSREVQPAIEAYLNEDASHLVQQVEKVKAARVAHNDEQAVEWLRNRGVSAPMARSVLERIEQEEGTYARTVWDMAQGLTAAARSIHAVEDRAEIETLAGSFWSKVAA
jgi:hypothetical protein